MKKCIYNLSQLCNDDEDEDEITTWYTETYMYADN